MSQVAIENVEPTVCLSLGVVMSSVFESSPVWHGSYPPPERAYMLASIWL
jgi:hypothetical protein